MWKKVTLGAFALLLGLLANTHMVCRVSINGEAVEGCYSPWAHDRGLLAAVKAADEILEGSTSLPVVKTGCGLSLRPPAGSAAELSGAVLDSARGIERLDAVYVNSVPLGQVEDGERLMAKLRGYLLYTMPTSAVGGTFSEELSVRRVYTRSGSATNYDDMVLLVSGMAPAVYVDREGNRVMG